MTNPSKGRRPLRVPDLIATKSIRKISALTAYDYSLAKLIDEAGIDLILVGDSLASVVQGHATTLPVTLEEMIYHCRCVSRAVQNALLVGDLPFLSYQPSVEKAIESAGRLLKEGGVSVVKLEGGEAVAPIISKLVAFDIPVIGHVGLTPQSFHRMGGHRLQGKNNSKGPGSRQQVFTDAQAVAQAGVCALVLEGIPADLAAEITEAVSIPTIGIGAGPFCDGQILVSTDMLGMNPGQVPSFVRRYADLANTIKHSVKMFASDVAKGDFPEVRETKTLTIQ